MCYPRFVLAIFCGGLWLLPVDVSLSQSVSEKSITQLIDDLKQTEAGVRRDAIYELAKRGDTSREVIDAYLNASNDNDVQVRTQSLTALSRAGGDAARGAVDALLGRMDERDGQVRLRAADAVGKIGEIAVKPLLEKWSNGSTEFKIAACHALQTMGPVAKSAVPVLLRAVQNQSGSDQRRSEESGDRPRRRDRESGNGNGSDPSISRYAASALVSIEPENLEVLLTIAGDRDLDTRLIGISGLAALREPSSIVIDRLKQTATDDAAQIREVGLIVLARSSIGSDEKELLLEAALLDSERSVRSAAIIGIGRARLGGKRFAERLAARLEQADLPVAISILDALSSVGPAARVGLESVVQCAQRLGVADAKVDDEAPPTAPIVDEEAEGSPGSGLPRELLVSSFANMGPEAVVDLLEIVSRRPQLESVVADALAKIGPPAINTLLAGTQDSNPAIQIASVRAIGAMRPFTEASLERLTVASGDPNVELRAAAVTALANASEENPAAQAVVMMAIQDESEKVRAVAVAALGDSGFSREHRREGFQRGLNDGNAEVRVAALTAISKTPGQMQRHAGKILDQTSAMEEAVRVAALKAMANVPKEVVEAGQFVSQDVVDTAVRRCLQDESVPVRIAATSLLPVFGLYASENAGALAENLSGPRDLIVATLEVLPKFPDDNGTVVAALLPLLAHESTEVRIAAVTAVSAVDRDPLRLTQVLLPLLDDPEWVVRRIAGQTLGRQGSVAVTAVPKLFELLGRHEDKDYAAESLRQIDTAPAEIMPVLIDHVDSTDRRKAFYAVTLLGKLGPVASDAVPKLEALLQSDSQGGTPLDDFRRNTIRETLAKLKPETEN